MNSTAIDDPSPERASYQRSGKVDWFKFLIGFAITCVAALAMAFVLSIAYRRGFYWIYIAPVIAASVVCGVWFGVLVWSRCRNRTVATAASVVLAILLYFGYYYFCLLPLMGPQNAHRIDFLPNYILFRIDTDRPRKVGEANNNNVPIGPDFIQRGFNWTFLISEFLMVGWILTRVGRTRSSKAFCEPCDRWMSSESYNLSPGAGTAFWQAFRRGDYPLAQQALTNTSRVDSIAANLVVEHCPSGLHPDPSGPVYLSVSDILLPGMLDVAGVRVRKLFKSHKGPTLHKHVDQVELEPEEVAVLSKHFPGLERKSPDASVAGGLRRGKAARPGDPSSESWKGRYAIVEDVEAGDAGTVLTQRNVLFQTVIGLVSGLGFLFLAFVPFLVLIAVGEDLSGWLAGLALGWLFVFLGINLGWAMYFARYPTARFMARQARRAFRLRADPAIDPTAPGPLFVDIIPRANWGKIMMENASDIGFLHFDEELRELIFEGDRQRYWIPVESILEIKHEFWGDPASHQRHPNPNLNHVVVVRAMTEEGPWETWFYQRQNRFRPHTAGQRVNDALELENRIRSLIG